jgi:hypothetical protein
VYVIGLWGGIADLTASVDRAIIKNNQPESSNSMSSNTETPTNGNGHTFKQWYRLADRAVEDVCGLGLDDLPDGNSWDAWNNDESPVDYARMVLEEEGFPFNE